ncbi:MAG TPA: acetylornithine deacetylase [Stellaceae bacterium]|nr:acetylornithine deacetylase [Stellaceae bacterium]
MAKTRPATVDLLEKLVAFPTVSRDSNLDLVRFVQARLAPLGAALTLVPDESGRKASLCAVIGSPVPGGIILSGHTDVVPVDGQAWSSDPFRLRKAQDRLYGRGTADMKGFLAASLRAAALAARRKLARPLHLAFSYDEEIGCVGVRPLLDELKRRDLRPALCIVGEPTGMEVVTRHKGKTALRATCRGREAHSAAAPTALNAIHLAVDLIDRLRRRQTALACDGTRDPGFDVPFSTIHVGRIEGGTALNIVPGRCTVDFEFRTLAADDPARLLDGVAADAAAIVRAMRDRFPEAAIEIETVNQYPGLAPADDESVRLAAALAGAAGTSAVAFGSEAGLYREVLGVPAVLCGPGSMAQGHKADEYVTADQLARCDAMLDAVIDRLAA